MLLPLQKLLSWKSGYTADTHGYFMDITIDGEMYSCVKNPAFQNTV